MTTILIALPTNSITEAQIERVHALAPEARIVLTDDRAAIEQVLADITVAAGHFPLNCIPRAPRLRWFQQWGAGTDWLMRHPEIARLDFTLTNASGVHAVPISEHILAFLLAFARRLPESMRAQSRRAWERDGNIEPFELAGKTMLLVGVGAIGKRTAHIATAMGMHVVGMRRDPSKPVAGIERMIGPGDLADALPAADIVVLTMPLTNETREMFNAEMFAKMKPSAYLVNIGRGGTVDEPALISALQSGQIAGAGLDVFSTEPLPEDSPLWDMPNVIITGHYSGDTPHYDERAVEIFIDNLERFMDGKPMRNVVDKQRGY